MRALRITGRICIFHKEKFLVSFFRIAWPKRGFMAALEVEDIARLI